MTTTRQPNWRRSLNLVLAALVLVSSISVVAIGCGDSTAQVPTYDLGSGSLSTKTSKGPITEDAIRNIVTRKLGDVAIAGAPMIREASLTPEGSGQHVELALNRTASCHPGLIVGIAVGSAQQIMSALFRYDDVSSIRLTLYGTTDNVEDINTKAAMIMVTRASADKIDWFQYNDSTAESLSDEFWAEPALYQNWKQYGGSAILDDAQRAAANAAAGNPSS